MLLHLVYCVPASRRYVYGQELIEHQRREHFVLGVVAGKTRQEASDTEELKKAQNLVHRCRSIRYW